VRSCDFHRVDRATWPRILTENPYQRPEVGPTIWANPVRVLLSTNFSSYKLVRGVQIRAGPFMVAVPPAFGPALETKIAKLWPEYRGPSSGLG
jgi:hypothetical protein